MKPRQKQTLLTWAGEGGAMEKEALNLPPSWSALFPFHRWQRKLKYLAQSLSGVARIQPWVCLKPNPCLSLQSRMQNTWLFPFSPCPTHLTPGLQLVLMLLPFHLFTKHVRYWEETEGLTSHVCLQPVEEGWKGQGTEGRRRLPGYLTRPLPQWPI